MHAKELPEIRPGTFVRRRRLLPRTPKASRPTAWFCLGVFSAWAVVSLVAVWVGRLGGDIRGAWGTVIILLGSFGVALWEAALFDVWRSVRKRQVVYRGWKLPMLLGILHPIPFGIVIAGLNIIHEFVSPLPDAAGWVFACTMYALPFVLPVVAVEILCRRSSSDVHTADIPGLGTERRGS